LALVAFPNVSHLSCYPVESTILLQKAVFAKELQKCCERYPLPQPFLFSVLEVIPKTRRLLSCRTQKAVFALGLPKHVEPYPLLVPLPFSALVAFPKVLPSSLAGEPSGFSPLSLSTPVQKRRKETKSTSTHNIEHMLEETYCIGSLDYAFGTSFYNSI